MLLFYHLFLSLAIVSFHADTPSLQDATLNYNNFGEAVKEWTGVFGVSANPTQTIANNPGSGWTKTVYGPKFEAYSNAGGTHGIPTQEGNIIKFFDLACTSNCFSRGK